jgi:hypothetical protein
VRALSTLPLPGNETHIAPGSMPARYAAISGLAAHDATVHITVHAIVERIGCCVRRVSRVAEDITQTACPAGMAVRA